MEEITNQQLTKEESDELQVVLPYRFVKLTTGEDLITQLVLNIELPHTYLLRYPFRIIYFDETKFALIPFVQFSDQEVIPIMRRAVISITTLRDDIRDIYIQRVAEHIEMRSSSVDQFTPTEPPVVQEEHEKEPDEEKEPKQKDGWIN